jgi:O-antigen/teichoic acid export membrane protein
VLRSPIGKRIAFGAFWSVAGNGIGKALTFVATIFVANILGTQLYGEWGLVRSATDIFIGLSSFGVGTVATAYIAELLKKDKQRVGRIIGLCYSFTLLTCILTAVTLYFAAPFVCESSMLRAPHLTNELRLSIVMLIFMTFMGTQIGVMAGFQDFRGLAFANFTSGFVTVPLYVGGAYYWGLSGVIVGMGAAALANVIVNSIFIYRNTLKYCVRYSFRDAWQETAVLWKLSLPTFLSVITFCIFTAIGRLILAAQPNGFHELGIFMAAIQIEIIIYALPTMIGSVVLPTLSELRGKNEMKKYKRLSNLILLLNIGIALVFVIPVILFSPWIMGLFGEKFNDGWIVLAVVCCGIVFHTGTKTAQMICVSLNRMWECYLVVLAHCIAQLILFYVFLQFVNAGLGYALAYSISYIIYFVGTFIIIRKNYNL